MGTTKPVPRPTQIAKYLMWRREGFTQEQAQDNLQNECGAFLSISQLRRWEKQYKNDPEVRKLVTSLSAQNGNQKGDEPEPDYNGIAFDFPQTSAPDDNGEFPAPSLKELLSRGIPKQVALQILVFWDDAVIKNQLGVRQIVKHLISILAEDPAIPFITAQTLAYVQYKADQFGDLHLFQVCNITKRYRPWEGPDNRKAFDTTMSKLYPRAMMKLKTNVPVKSGVPFVTVRANVYYKQLDNGQWVAIALSPMSITGLKISRQNTGDVLQSLTATEGRTRNEVIQKLKEACRTFPLPVPYEDRAEAKHYAKEYFGINTMPLEEDLAPKRKEDNPKEES